MATTTKQGYRVTNPATGEVVEEFPFSTDAEVQDALTKAQTAYEDWGSRTIEERAAVVQRAAELFEERKEELARIAATEMGKPFHEGVEEAEFSSAIVGYYAEHGPAFVADQEVRPSPMARPSSSACRSVRCWASCRGTSRTTRWHVSPARTSCSATRCS